MHKHQFCSICLLVFGVLQFIGKECNSGIFFSEQITFNITIIQYNQHALPHFCVTDGNTESTIYSFMAYNRSSLDWMGEYMWQLHG